MNSEKICEDEKRRLLSDLDVQYESFTINTISDIAEDLDIYLKSFLEYALKYHADVFFGLKNSFDNTYLTDESQYFYELKLIDDLSHSDNLLISLNVRGADITYSIREHSFMLKEGFGRYLQFNIIFPQKLKVKFLDIANLTKTIFETGYFWFYQQTLKLAQKEETALGINLYKYSKTIIHSKELVDNLWFGLITEGVGFRLLTESVVNESFKLINRNIKKFARSTNLFIAELITTKLPEKQLLMINAIKEKNSIDANLKNATYKETDSLYAATLKCLYGQNHFTVYPIFESNKFCVVALSETKYKNDLSLILTRHKIELEEISKNSIGKIRLFFSKLMVGKISFQSLYDTIELKPNILGFGVDLKKIIDEIRKSSIKRR